MARDPDDDALSWGDENDPTYAAAHPAALDEDDLEEDVPVVDAFSSAAPALPLPPQAPAATPADAVAPTPVAPGTAATSTPPSASSATAAATSAAATTTATATGTAAAATSATANATPTVEEEADIAEDAAAERDLADAEKEAAPLSSAGLIAFGVFGGIFLLYTVGWLVTFIRTPVADSSLAGIVQNAQGVLAIAAPALWFIVTLLVGAKRRVPVRVVWLLIGVVVLLPWPFLTGY
ncbi:hypothetical protein B7R54_04055 [Subtercola boreus]|uniref:DNA polymerase III subunit gamma/tau n=1 Tax=Subtercola boreus TaxID=120213 RepID=A0A3E0VFQ4_9MICO|nr:hypothetical protein [Subtercola boreus]RFA08489.1 hypothetical protein B7R54_04055 [Subtercola boreus]TQL54588.1 hypothetical protein FB464_2129 [Subtercola boreus]